MFCRKCGNQVADGAAFCPKCGNPMPQQAQQPQKKTEPAPPLPTPAKRRRWPIVVAIAVVAAAAIAVLLAFVVLPRVMPKRMWIVSRSVETSRGPDGESTDTTSYTLDNRGNLLSMSCETVSDEGRSKYDETYTYDERGYCKSAIYVSESTDSSGSTTDTSEITTEYQWILHDDGKPSQVARIGQYDNGSFKDTDTYEYNSDGNISKKTTISDSASGYSIISEYDENGLMRKNTFTLKDPYENDVDETTYNYEYDSSNKPIKITYVETDSNTGKKLREYSGTYEYDANGNLTTIQGELIAYPKDGSDPKKTTKTNRYEYTLVEDPSPWVARITRLAALPISSPS